MTTAKEEIKKEIKMISKYIRKSDKEQTSTYAKDIEQARRVGWESGLSWALTVIELEERGELEIFINVCKPKKS